MTARTIAPTPGAPVGALSSTSDQARMVSPAYQGVAWAPPFSATKLQPNDDCSAVNL